MKKSHLSGAVCACSFFLSIYLSANADFIGRTNLDGSGFEAHNES
jgi:hypothetical protein